MVIIGDGMRIFIYATDAEAVETAAGMVARQLQGKPASVLGLATGGTMEKLYEDLIARHHAGEISFAAARSFNLDEYVGLSHDHPQSYHHFMAERLFRQVDFPPGANHLPDGAAEAPETAAADYEALLARHGPIDLQLLGIGRNGHIGFNEPSSSLASRTRIKTLTRDTIEANARFFGEGERQPTQALTMGVASILAARRIVLVATGVAKARAVARAVEGAVSAMWPASALQMHADVTMLLDEAAAEGLEMRDYYRWLQSQTAP